MVLITLFAASFAFIMVNVIRWQDYKDWVANEQPFNRKPFNCVPCLSGWTGLALSVILGYGLYALLMLPICMVAGIALEGILNLIDRL